MTARERREREASVNALAIRIAYSRGRASGPVANRMVARYVLRLLAAERRKAHERAKNAALRWRGDGTLEDAMLDAILNGGRK